MEKIQTPKFVVFYLIFSFFMILIAWSVLVWNDTRIRRVDLSTMIAASAEDHYEYAIEDIDVGYAIRIRGRIIERKKRPLPVEIQVVLKEVRTGKGLLLPTTVVKREELTAEYNDGTNYDWSGFDVLIPNRNPIDIRNRNYQIMLLVNIQGKERLIDTGWNLERREANQ